MPLSYLIFRPHAARTCPCGNHTSLFEIATPGDLATDAVPKALPILEALRTAMHRRLPAHRFD